MERIKELWKLMYEESEGMISKLDLSIPSDSCLEAEEKGEEFLTKLDSVMEKNTITDAEKRSIIFLALSIVRDLHNRPEAFIANFIDELFISIADIIDGDIESYCKY